MSDLAARDFHRILIIKPSSPGDIIHALPVLHSLRRRYPGAHIAWLVASPFAELISADPALNEIIPFDRQRYGFLGRSIRITWEFLAFLRRLRRMEFDLVIDLQGLFRSGFLSWAARVKTRIGFAEARELAWLFYTHKIPPIPPDTHAADRNIKVGELLGFNTAPMDFSITLTEKDRRVANGLIAPDSIRNPKSEIRNSYVVLVPATRWQTKCWPADRFGQLAALLAERCGLRSVLVGGASDGLAATHAVESSRGAAVSLCGMTTLRQAAAIIENAAIVITADSTPMHLAAALNRPLVALFGPTNPKRTGPYGRLDDVVRLDLQCSPCYYRRLSQCPFNHACMRDLEVQRVFDAVQARLAHPAAARL